MDIGIQGDGYLMVQRGNNTYYTRAGNLYLDDDANLVTASGDKVKGADGTAIRLNGGDATVIKSLSISNDGTINFLIDGNDTLQTAGPIGIARFNNNGGLEKLEIISIRTL